jgi:D-alanyl-D-alanine carboxypeptidase
MPIAFPTCRPFVLRTASALLLSLLTGAAALAAAPKPAGPTATIDALLKGSFPADRPGAAVIVTKDGQALFEKAYGMADLELGVPLRTDMVFRLGSITKQFTAVAILMLWRTGSSRCRIRSRSTSPDTPPRGTRSRSSTC